MNRRAFLRITVLVAVFGLGSSGVLANPAFEPPALEPPTLETQPSSIGWQQLTQQVNWQGGPPPRWGGGR